MTEGHIIDELTLNSHEYRLERFGYEKIEVIVKSHKERLPKKVLEIGSASGISWKLHETEAGMCLEFRSLKLQSTAAGIETLEL